MLGTAERQVDAAQRPLVEMEDKPEDHAPDEAAGQELHGVHIRQGKPGADAGAQGYAETYAEAVHSTLIIGSSACDHQSACGRTRPPTRCRPRLNCPVRVPLGCPAIGAAYQHGSRSRDDLGLGLGVCESGT